MRSFPDNYLKHAYEHVRAGGGVCIADEVQTGFGRTGTHYWGFETQNVIPDIVTMAKGIGNGARSPRLSRRRKSQPRWRPRTHFNTFGGNPVVCAQGKAVLDVIDREKFQAERSENRQPHPCGLDRLKESTVLLGTFAAKV